ncbi:MAG: hypothetical protein ABI818_15260, partial [Acidobacteriota bacterium]
MVREIRRRFAMLSPAERLRWASMAPLGLGAAVLEAAGGALVFALLTVILDPAGSSRITEAIRARVPGADPRNAVLTLAACAAAVHLARNLLILGVAWWRARVVAFDAAALSTRLLRAYVAASWPFHLQRGSPGLIENIRESARPFFEVFESAATILTEAAVVGALAAVAIAVAPLTVTAVCAGIVAVVAAGLRLTRAAQRRGGARQFELGTSLYRHVQHSLGAIKEIRILGRGRFFVDAFSRDARERAKLDTLRAALDALPRVLLETMFVLGMLAVLVLNRGAGNGAAVLPLISLYAYTGFRVIPAAHRIAVQINNLRWGLAATAPLVDDLHLLEGLDARDDAGPRLAFHDRLDARGVVFSYEGTNLPVLRGVTLTVRRGESVAIVGATG